MYCRYHIKALYILFFPVFEIINLFDLLKNTTIFQFNFRNYKLNIREESDVAFIRLFECFLEAAPQKILQISIVLGQIDKMTSK